MLEHIAARRPIRTYVPACLICLLVLALSAVHSAEPRSFLRSEPGSTSSLHQLASSDVQLGIAFNGAQSDPVTAFDARLIGFWEYRAQRSVITLEFVSENQLVFAGRQLRYTVLPGLLRVLNDDGEYDYTYEISGNELVLDMNVGAPGTHTLTFRRLAETVTHSISIRSAGP